MPRETSTVTNVPSLQVSFNIVPHSDQEGRDFLKSKNTSFVHRFWRIYFQQGYHKRDQYPHPNSAMLNSLAMPILKAFSTSAPVTPLPLNFALQSHPLSTSFLVLPGTSTPLPPTLLPSVLRPLSSLLAIISLPIMLKLKFEFVPELTLFFSIACGLGGALPCQFLSAACIHSSAASKTRELTVCKSSIAANSAYNWSVVNVPFC